MAGHSDGIDAVALSPNQTILASASFDGVVKLWDMQTHQTIKALIGHSTSVNSLAFSPDGSRLATASWDATIKLWDPVSFQVVATLRGHTDSVSTIAFSPDGFRLGSASSDGTIKLWEARPGHEATSLEGHNSRVANVTFSPDGTQIFSQSRTETLTWDLETRKLVSNDRIDPPEELSQVSQDGRWRVTSERNNVVLVDLAFGTKPEETAYRTAKACFSPTWHRRQADEAVAVKDWFAATHHFALLMQHDPDQASLYEGLQSSYQNLHSEFERDRRDVRSHLVSFVYKSLKLPRGHKLAEIGPSEAQSINKETWMKVSTPDAFEKSPLTKLELERYHELIRQHPHGTYYNTLATAEYRMGNYRVAVDAALKSIELLPSEFSGLSSPFPGDYAIVAMSYFKLGDNKLARDYRDKLGEAMNQDQFKGDNEFMSFSAEVEALFSER